MNMLFSLDLNVHANPKVTGWEFHKKGVSGCSK